MYVCIQLRMLLVMPCIVFSLRFPVHPLLRFRKSILLQLQDSCLSKFLHSRLTWKCSLYLSSIVGFHLYVLLDRSAGLIVYALPYIVAVRHTLVGAASGAACGTEMGGSGKVNMVSRFGTILILLSREDATVYIHTNNIDDKDAYE
jgi:hypothetical protein